MGADKEYQSPVLVIIGGVSELTQQVNKEFGNADGGITFEDQPTTIVP